MNFAILGPLEVTGPDGPIAVAGRIRRSLLLRLLLQANLPVPDDGLAFDLWSGAPKPGAQSTLASHVSLLRKTVGSDRILHQAGGYLVVVRPGELDASEFESAAGGGQASLRRSEFARAAGQLQAALSLWRGRALADVEELDWARGEVARLEELRIEAGESLLTAQIVMGQSDGIVAAAEAAVRAHPLRERGWAILMTALYRSGRQTEALRAYQRLRTYLSDELGVDPSPELANLEEAMLLQRADLPWPDPQFGGSYPPSAERRRPELMAVVAVSGEGDGMGDASAVTPEVAEAMATFGGRVNPSASGGALLLFPSATSAIEAAVAIQQGRTEIGRPPMALAISTGEVRSQGASFVGAAVDEAVDLVGRSQPGDILVTPAVQMLADPRGRFPFEAVHAGPPERGDGYPPAFRLTWTADAGTHDPLPLVPALALAPGGVPFVGRTGPQDALARLAERAEAGERQIVLVSGEPGIGKSSLVAAFARQARASGANVLYGRCLEVGHPFQPFAEALGTFVQHARSEDLHRHVASYGGEAGRLVPALSRRLPGTPAPTVSDPETERFLAFQAAIGLLGEACRERLAVLVLEDLHWSDTGSLALLHYLAVADQPSRLMVIGTFRSTDLDPDDPLVDVLASLWREHGVSRVDLEGLTLDEITELCLAMTGGHDQAMVAALSSEVERETAGNALFACELLRQRSEAGEGDGGEPATTEAGPAPVAMSTSLHEVVMHRIRRLGAKAERALGLAAVIGGEFSLDVLGSVADVPVEVLLDVLEAAERAAIIADEGGTYGFRHALIRRTLYDDIRDSRRRQVHARVATALEADGVAPSVLAHHYLAAGLHEPALVQAERAGHDALESMAPAEAATWFGEVERLLERLHPDDLRRRCDAVLQRGISVRLSGGGDYREILLEAVAMAKEAGDGRRMATAALANTRGFYSAAGQRDQGRIDALGDCLAMLGGSDPALRARLLATMGSESVFGSSLDERRDLARLAKKAANQVGDARTLLETYNLVAEMLRYPTELAERLRDTAVALELASRVGDPAAEYWAAGHRMRALVETGAVEEAEQRFVQMAEISERLGQPVMQWMTLFTSAKWSLLRGETAEGERLAEEALELGTAIGQPDAFNYYATQLSHARWQQGRLVEIIDLIEQGERDNPGIPAYRGALARAYCQAGRPDEARALLSASTARGFDELPEDLLWTYGMVAFAEAAIVLDDVDAAAVLYDALAPFDDQVSYLGTTCEGPIAHYLGGLAVTLDELGLAERHLGRAADFAGRAKSPYFACRTLIEAARRDGRTGATSDAARSLQRAATMARQGGFAGEAARANALLGRAG